MVKLSTKNSAPFSGLISKTSIAKLIALVPFLMVQTHLSVLYEYSGYWIDSTIPIRLFDKFVSAPHVLITNDYDRVFDNSE